MSSNTHLIAAGVIGVAFAVGFLTGPALADQPGPFAFDFKYTKAELANEASAAKLLARLEKSVVKHCTPFDTSRPLNNPVVQKCVSKTMAQTIAGMGSSTLAQAYKSRADG